MLALRESRGTEVGRENVWKLLRKFNERENLMGCASNGEEPEVGVLKVIFDCFASVLRLTWD